MYESLGMDICFYFSWLNTKDWSTQVIWEGGVYVTFWCQTALQRGCIILYPYCHCMGIPAVEFTSSPTLGVMRIFNFSHCTRYMISHCGFSIDFPTNDVQYPFRCLCDILYVLWQCFCPHILSNSSLLKLGRLFSYYCFDSFFLLVSLCYCQHVTLYKVKVYNYIPRIYFVTGGLYLLTTFTHFFHPQPMPLTTTNLICFCEFDFLDSTD